jgi:hypothetical protein
VAESVTSCSGADGADFKGFSERNGLRVAVYSLASGKYEFTVSGSAVAAK